VAILHIPLDALLPFAYPDNFQVTWLRLRRSLRWGTWGRQPFSGATKGGSRWQKPSITARYRWSRSVPWFYAWQLLARPCGLSFPGFKSCSASRLSRFYSKSWMARLVNRLQRCKSAYSSGRFWKLSSKTQFPFWSKFKPIPATFINIIQVWQFRLPLLLPQGPGPLPSSPALHVTEGKGALKENEAAHEAKMYHV